MLDLLTKGRIMSKQTKMADAIVAAITSGKVPKTSDGKNPIAKAMSLTDDQIAETMGAEKLVPRFGFI